MQASLRVVTQLPLQELWDHCGPVSARRVRDLAAAGIRELLRSGSARFVVADVGKKLEWIPDSQCYEFWKSDVLPHLAVLDATLELQQFPGEYAYFASEWQSTETPIIVLERCH